MNVISKMKKYYRDKKSAAFKLIDPGEPGKRLYFEGRKDYKDTLIKLLLATVDRLQSLGVGARVMIGDDVGYTYKTNKTDEAA